jgi:SNF2 family DNA or RNA helicase
MLEDLLGYKDYKYERLDGSRDVHWKQSRVSRNAKIPSCSCCQRARVGGPDTVIIYDFDWNPQADI